MATPSPRRADQPGRRQEQASPADGPRTGRVRMTDIARPILGGRQAGPPPDHVCAPVVAVLPGGTVSVVPSENRTVRSASPRLAAT